MIHLSTSKRFFNGALPQLQQHTELKLRASAQIEQLGFSRTRITQSGAPWALNEHPSKQLVTHCVTYCPFSWCPLGSLNLVIAHRA